MSWPERAREITREERIRVRSLRDVLPVAEMIAAAPDAEQFRKTYGLWLESGE